MRLGAVAGDVECRCRRLVRVVEDGAVASDHALARRDRHGARTGGTGSGLPEDDPRIRRPAPVSPVVPCAFVALHGVPSPRAGFGAGRASLRCWTAERSGCVARIPTSRMIDAWMTALAARAEARPAASTSMLALARALEGM